VDGMEVEEIVGAGQLSPEERKRDRQTPRMAEIAPPRVLVWCIGLY
jgi:hypothetical protein